MSIEIDWDALTKGPEGAVLAESIRAFIHDKFQELHLPGFIRSVEVHTFEFGNFGPSVVIKDICDPLPDFYEEDEEEEEEAEDFNDGHDRVSEGVLRSGQHDLPLRPPGPVLHHNTNAMQAPPLFERRDVNKNLEFDPVAMQPPRIPGTTPLINNRLPAQSKRSLADQLASPLLSRSSTPGIPGGTSSLSYFHLPLAHHIQGTGPQSPMSAVAGWQEHQAQLHAQRFGGQTSLQHLPQTNTGHAVPPDLLRHFASPTQGGFSDQDPSTRPSTAHSQPLLSSPDRHAPADLPSPRTPPPAPEPDASDMQVVLHISYSGNIRLSLTAEILLDYPMPSFMGIPLKLNITGLNFDGVALLALLNSNSNQDRDADEGDRRAHFCFLGPEDAETLVGAENILDTEGANLDASQHDGNRSDGADKMGSLLRELRVESEIGKTKDGRQNLKNVGKVEKFILEQVRRIFEDEFVYPSFWTFLM